jgi:hypothetical protein
MVHAASQGDPARSGAPLRSSRAGHRSPLHQRMPSSDDLETLAQILSFENQIVVGEITEIKTLANQKARHVV